MESDIVLAAGSATTDANALFAQNNHHNLHDRQVLCRAPGRPYAAGETVYASSHSLPQVRQTATVLGCQPVGTWGFCNGINSGRLAIGSSGWRSKLAGRGKGVLGTDLVRLALERCTAARPALDFIADQVCRHGQTTQQGEDNVFLIADPREAYLLETAGTFYAWTECRSVRAVSGTAVIRQDWQRLAPGIAELAISEGWWECDGNKIDFVGCLADQHHASAAAQRRWGRTTYLLEQHRGAIDLATLLGLLGQHSEENETPPICRHGLRGAALHTCNSSIAALGSNLVFWCAFGPPCQSVHVPLFLEGELPEAYTSWHPASVWVRTHGMLAAALTPQQVRAWRQTADRLQNRILQETQDFLAEMRGEQPYDSTEFARQATLFMQSHAELLENSLRLPESGAPAVMAYADKI